MNQRKETKMKTKVYWLALLASAAIVSQTQAHGFGGGGFGGAHFGGAGFGGGRPAIGHAVPAQGFAPNHAAYANRYPTYNHGTFANQSARNHVAYSYSRRNVTNVGGAHNLPTNRLDHVYARQSANWHHGWDRSRDHWWNGHRCRFINGNWVIFDVGFDPWWPCPGYDDGYPCDDYGY
jgi:hypothetical protein